MEQISQGKKTVREIAPNILQSQVLQSVKQLRVAAYCRVSTDSDEQEMSFDAQVEFYTDKIMRNPEWRLAGIFADEGISGTQAAKRPQFMQMIRQCKQGRIDMIITKSVSRFARNTVDCIKYVRELKAMGIPVIFNLLPMLLIEFHRPAGFPILGVNLFRPAVIPDRLPLPVDLLHPVLLSPEGGFQIILPILQ